ncbi:CDP-glycerol glycerophosphotransferase family protein [Brevibacterium metallidurans]|uniref:CDP-glycerol glycerophosphotransferase family protein n=1 Tax=Brevibacterium metallidurans TaxID=1482676 RepID=A0ABP3C606_9MICO
MRSGLKKLTAKKPPFKRWARATALAALESKPWQATSRWIRGAKAIERLEAEFDGAGLETPVIAYFGDGPAKIYQILQWIPILEELDRTNRVAIVLRSPGSLQELRKSTSLPLVLKRRFDPLQDFYFALDPKVALYVNNGVRNFQSLGYAPMVHVHLNHGESDKISMVSNQVKAYDRVLVAGPAAIERHRKALIEFDFDKLVEVGRPQLDIDLHPVLPRSDNRTIMYAPTWEGENDANNYTSLDLFGVTIAEAILKTPHTRFVYKPHPRVETSDDPAIVAADARIRELIDAANAAGAPRTGEHLVSMQGDILPMFADVDLLVADISSVGLDYLYLRPERPLILTDRRDDLARIHAESPISRATPVISASTISDVATTITAELDNDTTAEQRRELRAFYFGDRAVGDSTRTFTSVIADLIRSRQSEMAAKAEAE